MLDSFDQRLVKLESSILPIHRSTQKLTRIHDSMWVGGERKKRKVFYFFLFLNNYILFIN